MTKSEGKIKWWTSLKIWRIKYESGDGKRGKK